MSEKVVSNVRKEEPEDLRPADIALLGLLDRDWVEAWEGHLCKESYRGINESQKHWHLSRLSFLAGYELAKKELAVKELIEKIQRMRLYLKDSMLAACASDIPKSWIKENEPLYKAQNSGVDKALDAVLELLKKTGQNKENSEK